MLCTHSYTLLGRNIIDMTKLILFFLLAIASVSTLVAQSTTADYVVMTKGDTLRGEAKLLSYDLLDRVQISVNKKKTSYTAMQVKSVFTGNKLYHAQRYENSIRFMQVVKSGYLSLYQFKAANQATYDSRFLVKMGGKGIEVPNLGFKKLMIGFLEDCPEVSAKIKDEVLKRNDLDQIIDEYNVCIDTKTKLSKAVAVATITSNEKLEVIKNLQAKVTAIETLAGKKDVLDLLADISDKATRLQSIPNYQLEALKGYLNESEAKPELDKLLAVLKQN